MREITSVAGAASPCEPPLIVSCLCKQIVVPYKLRYASAVNVTGVARGSLTASLWDMGIFGGNYEGGNVFKAQTRSQKLINNKR
jgi:hypothetical protein